MDEFPLVCVGVPVYNESAFLEKTLESLIAQTYKNIKIIISDNCSVDRTGEICEEFAKKYPNVVYHRCASNKGVTQNTRLVIELASVGKYFMLASGHDLWSSDHIEKCVCLLEENPSAALAYSQTFWISVRGEELGKGAGWYDTRGVSRFGRFFIVLWGSMNPVLGVIRTEYLRQLPELPGCVGSDLLMLSELALMGDFLCSSDSSWYRRENRKTETNKQKVARYKSGEFNLTNSFFDRLFPFCRLPIELIKIVFRSDLSFSRKLTMLMILIPSMAGRFLDGRGQ